MKAELQELYRYRGLLWAITSRDVNVKYKQSVMGFMWAVLMPLLIVSVGVLVRYAMSFVSHAPMNVKEVLGVAIRSLPWAFAVASIRFASNSLISNSNLVTKIYFPKEIFPLSCVGANLFDFAIATVPLLVLLAIGGVGIGIELFWVPVLILVLIMNVACISIFVSAASLFFRDVKYIVEVALTFGIFFTPVFYDVSMFGNYGKYFMLNPLSVVMEGLDHSIIQHAAPSLGWLAYSFVFGAFGLVFSYVFFKRLEPVFAESI